MDAKPKGIINFMAAHPTAANLLMLIFVVLGLSALPQLKRETFPDFAATKVQISAAYPGATPEDVEDAICQRIEDAVENVNFVEEVTSTAVEGSGSVTLEMAEGGDISRFLDDIRSEVDAIDDFPDGVESPIISEMERTDMVLSIALSGPMSFPDLKLYAEGLKDRLKQLPDVSQVTISGFSDHQIRIHVPAAALMRHALSVQDIADAIQRQNLNLPAGTVETKDQDVMIRFNDERKELYEFEDLVIVSSTTGAELRLGEIAKVIDTFENDNNKFLFNGKPAAMLQVNKTKNKDSLRAQDAVMEFLDKERQMAPPTVEFTITKNITKIVRDRLELLTNNGWQGLLLVFGCMWLFFGFRLSFWVAAGLPIAFLGGLWAMPQMGMTLNMITMVGLLMAIGLIMDDAIVIAENIAAHLKRGKSSLRAAVDGTSEVAVGVLSSFATTILIFGTIALLLEGNIGKVLWVMPLVLIVTLGVSIIEAFLILPNHLAHSLHGHEKDVPNRFRRTFDAGFEWMRENIVGRLVDTFINWRYVVFGLAVALLITSIGMLVGGRLKTIAFPDIDGDVAQALVLLPQGTPLERTEEVVDRITQALDVVNREFKPSQPGEADLVDNVNVLFGSNSEANESGAHVATVTVDLLSAEERSAGIDEFLRRWREETGDIQDVISLVFKEPQMGPGGKAIDIRLQGHDLKELKKASLELMQWLETYPGVVDLRDSLRPGKPEMIARLKPGAKALGFDAQTVATQLRSAFQGASAGEIFHRGETYEIDVRMDEKDKSSLSSVDYFYVTGSNNTKVPLSALAYLEQGRGYSAITRVNGYRTVTIQGDVDTKVANSQEILSDTQARFIPQLLEKYPEMQVSLEGQASEGKKTGQSMLKALGLGIFGVFVLLSFQFRSYFEPIVVLMAIPMAFVGVVWGHLLMGYELSMPSNMGFISLAGVVVNDSILLVEFIKLGRKRGEATIDAARKASRQRFRAVLLTSLTTVLGLVPLLTERSLQAQVLIPLVVSLVFGLIASTLLVLFVLPCMYAILDDFGLAQDMEEIEEGH